MCRRSRRRNWLKSSRRSGSGEEWFGLLVARGPKLLRQTGPWAGLALALALALPNLLFQVQHDWTSLEFYRIATFTKNISTPPLDGLIAQVMAMNVATFPFETTSPSYFWTPKTSSGTRMVMSCLTATWQDRR